MWAGSGGSSEFAAAKLDEANQAKAAASSSGALPGRQGGGDGGSAGGWRTNPPDSSALVWNQRAGPVDNKEDILSASEFANVYLGEVRMLATVHAGLCSMIDEVRCSGACTGIIDPPDEKSFVSSSSLGDMPTKILFDGEEMLNEEVAVAEDGLKLLRYVSYASPYVRTTLLLSAGKTRFASAQRDSDNPNKQIDGDAFVLPLRAALEVGVFGSSHPWKTMRKACVQLVESFGDHDLQWDADEAFRLKMAVMHLITGIKIGRQFSLVKQDLIGLSADKTFASPVVGALGGILASVSSSSATPENTPEAAAVAAAAAAGAGGGKGKAAASATPAGALAGPTGRDALFLLMTTLREFDPLWTDGFEADLAADLHSLLKKDYPVYGEKAALRGVPDPVADITGSVAGGSVSVLWLPTHAPANFASQVDPSFTDTGLYTHVAAYFLLGNELVAPPPPVVPEKGAKPAKGAPPAPMAPLTPPADPVLTKAVLYRAHLTKAERLLRNARDRLTDATLKNWPDVTRGCAEEVGRIMGDYTELLVNGILPGLKPQIAETVVRPPFEVTETGPHAYVIEFNFEVRRCKLTVSDDKLESLANIFACAEDSDAVQDNEICILVRAMFGHGEN